MHKRETTKIVLILLIVMALIISLAWVSTDKTPDIIDVPISEEAHKPVPDFAAIKDITEKKKAFFSYLQPEVDKQNEYLLTLRHYLQTVQRQVKNGQMLTEDDLDRIDWLRDEYRVKEEADLETALTTLLMRVDILPHELVLMQAANESAWGASRFAQEGFNFFGLWCYRQGCGFVPSRRNKNASHEVAKFDNVSKATYTYMRNLNRHNAYRELRQIRASLRRNQMPITGLALSEGLMSYSERGAAYVEELQDMMRFNQEYITE